MCLAQIKSFLRERLEFQGRREYTEAIDTQNIPSTFIDRSYQIIFKNISRSSTSNNGLVLNYAMQVKVYRKGFRSTHEAVDLCALESEDVIASVMNPEYRLTNLTFKSVNVDNISIDAFSESNDNLCVVTMDLSFLVFFEI